MLTDGFVVIPRRLVTSDFFNDNEKFAILIKLFFEVRFRETNVNGIDIGVNQFICTKADLAERMNINERKLKYILERFQRAGLIKTENIRNKYTLITLLCGEAKVSVKRTENVRHIEERRSTVISARSDTAEGQTVKTYPSEAVGIEKKQEINLPESIGPEEEIKISTEAESELMPDASSVKEEAEASEESINNQQTDKTNIKNYSSSGAVFLPGKIRRKYGLETDSQVAESLSALTVPDSGCTKPSQDSKSVGKRKPVSDDNGEKKAYGDFSNVLLTEYEYGLFREKTPLADNYINKFSSYLVNHPEKNYISHFAQLLSHYNSDKISGREEGSKAKGENNENGTKTFIGFSGEPLSPLPGTSYDLIRAMEKIEKSVPVLRKRERR